MDTGELRRKWGVWRSAPWWPAVLLVLVQTLNGMWYMPQLSFFPVYLQELGLPPAAIGGVVAGAQLAGMAVALLGGWVTGLLGSKWVLVCGLALSGVASLAFQIHTPWIVAALWFIGGAGLALITVGGASYLTRRGPARDAGDACRDLRAQHNGGRRDRHTHRRDDHRAPRLQRVRLGIDCAHCNRGAARHALHDLPAGSHGRTRLAAGLLVWCVGHDPAGEGATVAGAALPAHHLLRHAHRAHPRAAQWAVGQQTGGGGLCDDKPDRGFRRATVGRPLGRSLGRARTDAGRLHRHHRGRPRAWRPP